MNVFSYAFFILWAISAFMFYTIARKHQWTVLLIMSLLFYGTSAGGVPTGLIFVSVLTYSGAVWILDARENRKTSEKNIRRCRWGITCLCIAVLVMKPNTKWFALLGNSYFILKAISYLNDVDRDGGVCERNYLFYLLYLIYLPTILQGPFNRFGQFKKSLGDTAKFDYNRFMHGVQRFLWGTFKKLVLAARLEQITTLVSSSWESQSGLSVMIGIAAYSLWLYTDFSSYMDMMLGISQTFGISLPENFRQPYFSKSIAEFWRRWHITLGGIFRDYLMMPFIQSEQGRNLRKRYKKYGKNAGKLAPTLAGTCIVWISTALWHGLSIRYLVWGMYYCAVIVSSLILERTYGRIKERLRIASGSKGYAIFCILRTWGLLFVANVILLAKDLNEFRMIFRRLAGRNFLNGSRVSLSALGWLRQDAFVLATGLLILISISILKERNADILGMIDRQSLPVRWSIYYILLFSVLMFGMYGPQHNAGEFLYMQF